MDLPGSGVRVFVGEDEGRISSCEQVFPRFTYGLEGYGGAPWTWTCVHAFNKSPEAIPYRLAPRGNQRLENPREPTRRPMLTLLTCGDFGFGVKRAGLLGALGVPVQVLSIE